jgi:hypothetical protein
MVVIYRCDQTVPDLATAIKVDYPATATGCVGLHSLFFSLTALCLVLATLCLDYHQAPRPCG